MLTESMRATPGALMQQPDDAERTHSVQLRWQDPGPLFASRPDDSGLDYLRGMADGEVLRPPVAQALGIEVVSADPGKVRFSMPVHPFLLNHLGFLAGGIVSTVMDVALGCAVLSAVRPDQDIVTVDLRVEFLRPVTAQGAEVVVDAEVVHLGRNRALAECRAVDGAGRLVAVGSGNCLIRPKAG
jgi:uncharacterized protein (TIGR00369 family)